MNRTMRHHNLLVTITMSQKTLCCPEETAARNSTWVLHVPRQRNKKPIRRTAMSAGIQKRGEDQMMALVISRLRVAAPQFAGAHVVGVD